MTARALHLVLSNIRVDFSLDALVLAIACFSTLVGTNRLPLDGMCPPSWLTVGEFLLHFKCNNRVACMSKIQVELSMCKQQIIST